MHYLVRTRMTRPRSKQPRPWTTAIPVAIALMAAAYLVLPVATHAQGTNPAFEAYGVVNYHAFDWDTDPTRRNATDIERLVFEANYSVSPSVEVTAEVEFEHGGAGVTMEFDRLEEFGEFEQEVEAGGEVIVERLELDFRITPSLNLRMGHIGVPIGLTSAYDEPPDYFTPSLPEAQSQLIPTTWHETGVGMFGQLGRFDYDVVAVTGLDSTQFSSASWVARGMQTRFETANAEDFALAGRRDYSLKPGSTVGVGPTTETPPTTAPSQICTSTPTSPSSTHMPWSVKALSWSERSCRPDTSTTPTRCHVPIAACPTISTSNARQSEARQWHGRSRSAAILSLS